MPKVGRKPSRHLWCYHGPNEEGVAKRRPLSWAEAMDYLDIHPDHTLVVKAKTYEQYRSMRASAAKAASRRLIAVDAYYEEPWLHFTVAR